MEKLMNKILYLANQGNYEEILKIIKSSEYRNDKKISNIKRIVERYLYIRDISPCFSRDMIPELTDNIWENYFKCIRVNNYEKAYEIILKIFQRNPNEAAHFYLIITKDIKQLVDINDNTKKKIDSINNQLLDLLNENRIIYNNDLDDLEFLLESKISLEIEDNFDCYLDILTLNLIRTIKQLNNEPFINKKIFASFDYKGSMLDKLYQSLEVGDYLNSLKYLKSSNAYSALSKNSDKVYPNLLYKLLKLLEYNCNKKFYKNNHISIESESVSQYDKLSTEIENDNYLEALKTSLENEYENDYSIDIVKILALRNDKE